MRWVLSLQTDVDMGCDQITGKTEGARKEEDKGTLSKYQVSRQPKSPSFFDSFICLIRALPLTRKVSGAEQRGGLFAETQGREERAPSDQ